ncbi:MAG: filamentous hemagglutinin N-terminal domain-containing protein, partial [Burkholderiaceae bacterium]|nr:filamentous hemagglutinin N-terminal domain-containing protein [Burkholderiaceae bacterium]
MNKLCYRIIFNKARGQLMAVAEDVAGQGKASGETPARSRRERPFVAAITPLAFLAWCLLGLVSLPAAHAQIATDSGAPGNQRPTVLNAPNGVPLVNIQTPSAAGVSRNTYSQFDVQQQGAILNNSRTNVQTQLGGWVQGNPWLAVGGAKVILNEVNSSNPSSLRGYVEVAGQRAQVVIANPAGVNCDGCGFINANRATITTGTPIFNGANLEGYRVQGGTVTITGLGLDASATDYTDIIARAIQVNAGIWANQLKLLAGPNQVNVDPASGDATVGGSISGTGSAPAFAIDTALLGGMYAGKIVLVATEDGVGVRNAGTMQAGSGDIVLTANGRLENAGQITSVGDTGIDTQGGVQNTGTVYAQGNTQVGTRGNIGNDGTIAAKGDATLTADGESSQIAGTSGSVMAAGVQVDGSVGATGNLTTVATLAISAQGQNLSGGDQNLAARHIDLSGSQTSARNLSVAASNGTVNLAGATVTANQTLNASASQTLRTDGANVSAPQILAAAHDLSNVQGVIVQTGSGDLTLNLPGTLDNTQGRIAANSANLNLAAATLINTDGRLEHAGTGALTIVAPTLSGARGQITSNGRLDLTATSATLDAANTTAGQLALHSDTLSHRNGTLIQTGGGTATLAASTLLDNTGGTIASNGPTSLIAGTLDNSAGRIEAAQTLSVSAHGIDNTDGTMVGQSLNVNSNAQSLDNTRGRLSASGTGAADTLTLQSGALNNDRGLIQATAALAVNTHGQTLTNTHSGASGGIVGHGTVNLDTGDLDNQAGYVGSGGGLAIHSAAIANGQGGILASSAQAELRASGLDNRGGQIQALGDIDVTLSGALDNTASLVRSGQTLTVHASGIANTHTQDSNQGLEGQSVRLSAGQIDNSQGAIRANNDVTLTSSGRVDNAQGLVSAGNTLTVRDLGATPTLAVTNTGGTLIAGQNLLVDSSSLGGDGSLLSQGDMRVRLTQDYVHTGQFIANGAARLETTGTLTNQSTLQAGTALDLKAATIDNQASGTISGTQVRLQATDSHTLTNRGLIDGSDTLIETATLNNLGTGRIFGDHVAIEATTVTNDAENGVAPVIAARNRLDIGADTINNREHALLFSAGDLAIGASLDASQRATGTATTLNNASATIEALGSLNISARHISNTNEHFSTTVVELPAQDITEYQGEGAPNRYTPGTPDVFIFNDESDHLHTPEGDFERWLAYNYTRSTTETRVGSSDPGQILSGGAMHITADALTNDKSRIIAGGALTGTIATLNNTEVAGERTITDFGTVTSFWRNQKKGRDNTGSSIADYTPAATIQAISLTPTVYQQNTAPGGSGTQISALATVTVTPSPTAASAAAPTLNGGQVITPITQVGALDANSANGLATVVRSGGVNTRVPASSLFSTNPEPNARFLVETDPA